MPAAAGGRVDFDLLNGTPGSSHTYLMLCSASGTSPGTSLLGATLPLNNDPLFVLSLTYPNAAPVFANTFGIKVYAIGAGTRGRAPVLVDSLFGTQVQYIEADLDEEALQTIASTTDGGYWRAEDAVALEAIYNRIDELERTEIETRRYMEYNERFAWLVLPAILFLLLEVLLLGTRFRKIP